MTPLEKAARALARLNHEGYLLDQVDEYVEAKWQRHVRQARAVLMAVREADEGMLRAAFIEMNRTPGHTWKNMKANNSTPREIFDAKEKPRFTAMIDHILRGGETG